MRTARFAAIAALALTLPLAAQEAAKPAALAPSEIVAAAPKADWVAIPAEDLLVMTLAPDADGKPRTVVIQLMPAPFSQGWVHNIRLFARAKWYDGISVNRVQDNYVTQWGDPKYDKQRPSAAGRRDAPAERVEEARADDDLIGAVRAGASCRQGDANGGCVGWHGWLGAGQGAGRGAGHRPRPHGRPQRGRFQETLTLSTSAGVTVITRANPVCCRW